MFSLSCFLMELCLCLQLEETIAQETAKVATTTATTNSVKEKHTSLESDVLKSEELLQTLLTGLTTSSSSKNLNNSGGGYMGHLAEAKALLAQGQAEEEQARVKLEMKQKDLESLRKRMKDSEREAGENKKKLDQMRSVVERQRQQLATCKWDQDKEEELEARLKDLKKSVRELTEVLLSFICHCEGYRSRWRFCQQRSEHIRHGLSRLNFEYTDPYHGFDRSKIRGFVAQVTYLDKVNYDKATALEITAGGKLFNVIVEDEQVGNHLLKNGKLKKRVTMIPLNKIKSYPIDQKVCMIFLVLFTPNTHACYQKINAAQRLAPGKVFPAISLVGYPEELARAMLFVFGNTFICSDSATAKAVTFNPSILTKSVTLEGDVYDPSGSLSGGSSPMGGKILIDVQKLLEVEGELNLKKRELHEAQAEEERIRGVREEWRRLGRELEIKEHELGLFEEQIGGSNASRVSFSRERFVK